MPLLMVNGKDAWQAPIEALHHYSGWLTQGPRL
jgi:hypothetical protein